MSGVCLHVLECYALGDVYVPAFLLSFDILSIYLMMHVLFTFMYFFSRTQYHQKYTTLGGHVAGPGAP